ncbi:hypothetical protein KAR91_79640 [Candidatus Pacearchaeota archaeon]|nr:hypothetical protein [Candidatus Pacearchaeota archaeon]
MEEMTILLCGVTNIILALVALEIDKSRPVRLAYNYSGWRTTYVFWMIGTILSIPAFFVYIHKLGRF